MIKTIKSQSDSQAKPQAKTSKAQQQKPSEVIYDVIIVGGGFTGSLLALFLHKYGFRICLIEKNPIGTPPPGLRAFSINSNSLDIFGHVNLKDKLISVGHAVNTIEVAEAHLLRGVSKNIITYESDVLFGKSFGSIIESPNLFKTIDSALRKLNPSAYTRKTATVVKLQTGDFDQPANVTLSTGEKISGWVVSACDGRNSLMRRLAKISRVTKNYNTNAIVCNLALEEEHCGIAVEYFYPSGPFAIVPLPDRKCNIIWCEKTSIAESLVKLPDAEFMKHLRWRFNNRFGKLQNKFLTRASFPLIMHNSYNYYKNRLVLIGDAAHGIHPIAGLGLNLGFRDVFEFSQHLKKTKQQGLLPGTNLAAYETKRRLDVQKLVITTDGINSIFSLDLRCVRKARQIAFHNINNSDIMKTLIVNSAT